MPFKLIYGTDGTEAEVGAPALVSTPADTNNVGFCLDYQERANWVDGETCFCKLMLTKIE
jgi:hypothetical protein